MTNGIQVRWSGGGEATSKSAPILSQDQHDLPLAEPEIRSGY
ncbi:hypothetical protein [Saccharothrix sp. ST-888]|nr:hypothetical protein [Saccharothrix sp. ST-888]